MVQCFTSTKGISSMPGRPNRDNQFSHRPGRPSRENRLFNLGAVPWDGTMFYFHKGNLWQARTAKQRYPILYQASRGNPRHLGGKFPAPSAGKTMGCLTEVVSLGMVQMFYFHQVQLYRTEQGIQQVFL